MRAVCLAVLAMLIVGSANAQSQRTEHTLKLDEEKTWEQKLVYLRSGS